MVFMTVVSDAVSDKLFNKEFSEERWLYDIREGIMIDMYHKDWFGRQEKRTFQVGTIMGKALNMGLPKGYRWRYAMGTGNEGQEKIRN